MSRPKTLIKTPTIGVTRYDTHVAVTVLTPTDHFVCQTLGVYEWRVMIEAEALAFGLIKPPVGADAEPAALAEMVVNI